MLKNTVKVERAKLGMSQGELASQIGVCRQTIYAIESGKLTPSIEIVLKMAEVFQRPVEDFFTLNKS